MQIRQTLKAVAIVGITVSAVQQYKQIQREERAKRAKINADTAKEIIVINRAAAVMQDRIRRGEYDRNLNLNTVLTDFEFEQIVQHEK